METHHRNGELSHGKWWIFPVRYVSHYQRVSISFMLLFGLDASEDHCEASKPMEI